MSNWTEVLDGIYRFTDSCQVYAIDIGEEMLIVNAGTGAWIPQIDALPKPVGQLALTHFFRDHTAGAVAAAGHGIEVWAPYWEQELISDPLGHFARRETYIIYDNGWDLFAPVEPVPVAKWLRDWESIQVGAATLTVLPTPGVSLGAITLGVEVAGTRVAFCGEMIHAPGKIRRIAPLQYNYNDLPGASSLLYSIGVVRDWEPKAIASSTGAELIDQPGQALQKLETNLRNAVAPRPGSEWGVDAATTDAIDRVTEHLYQSRYGGASTYFLISESKKALAIDYGYRGPIGHGGSYGFPRNRRPILHGIDALRRDHGIEGIDAVLVTHFHDDHVTGIPMLQRLFGTRCLAGENFAHILANPERYAFPCTWPEPITVEPLPLGKPFQWEEYRFTLHPMSGHTRFSTLIEFAVDDRRVVATGDQYFFNDFEKPGASPSMHNHVYQNGATLDSFAKSTAKIKEIGPEIILPGHGMAYQVPDEFFSRIESYTAAYEKIHTDLMPLDDDDLHFEVDSRAAWIEPYRTRLDAARQIEYVVHVRNPYPASTTITVKPTLPHGWNGGPMTVELPARAEGEVILSITPPDGATCRRHPIAIEIAGPDRSFGQVAEALVTIGHQRF